MRYFLELQYDGTNYSGWQKQPHAKSIQENLEVRLSNILDQPIEITGCGRTDKGVHAHQYFAHMEVSKHLDDSFLFRLNNYLPPDIAVKRVIPVSESAHARFDATQRTYRYKVHYNKNPFLEKYSFYYQKSKHFSLTTLNTFAESLPQFSDFKSFAKFHSDVHHHRCHLKSCTWESSSDGFILEITSDRFLRGMVRLIVGASLRFAEGKITLKDLDTAMESGEQIKAPWAVPAHGLSLIQVEYPYL